MPYPGYANLSILSTRKDEIERKFESLKLSSKSFSLWATDLLDFAVKRLDFLNKTFPHLKVIENYDNRFLIEDHKKNKIVKVEWRGTKAVCNDPDESYVTFAMLHPEFRLK